MLLPFHAEPPQPEERALVAPALAALLAEARRVAPHKVPVLLEGESGTGKELVARLIHAHSRRAERSFVSVNCAALSESLIESELFGHEKGAYTGAESERPGRFELADGGTLLLDEVSEMPVKLQAKFLRVLEEEELERVGGIRTLRVDVRVIATTNRDLQGEVARGTFRGDLYYRLNAVQIRLPPLRDRVEDIPPLVEHFLARFARETNPAVRGVAPKTLALLTAYAWPGNVRQLRNVIHRACILARGPLLQPEDLPPLDPPTPAAGGLPLGTLEEVERHVILSTLRDLGGNKSAAAARLGVTPRTLLNKLNRYRGGGPLATRAPDRN